MRSKRRHEGWLLIDNRHAPGVTLAQARVFGEPVAGAGAGGAFESATVTCAHCHAVVVLNPQRTRARGYCRCCDHYVCDKPECSAGCLPLNRVFDIGMAAAACGASAELAIRDLRRDVLGL